MLKQLKHACRTAFIAANAEQVKTNWEWTNWQIPMNNIKIF